METNLLQSKQWQKLQQDLGKKTFYEENEHFQYLATLETTPLGNYLYVPYGPCYDSAKSFKKALESLQEAAKNVNAFFIRIEPRDPAKVKILSDKAIFQGHTIRKTTDLNPKETWTLNLNGTDEDLKQKLPSRLLRYYRTREKNGITIEISKNPEDIHYLVDLQAKLAKSKKINIFSNHYLQTELQQDFATLYLVKKEGEVIAAGLVFDDETTRYNLQGAQDEAARKFHATGILTIQLILDAKAKNLATFDFWGIAPEDAPANHPWSGFTAFKKTFAGHQQNYCGTYDLILNKKKYTTYKIVRKINRLVRKLK